MVWNMDSIQSHDAIIQPEVPEDLSHKCITDVCWIPVLIDDSRWPLRGGHLLLTEKCEI